MLERLALAVLPKTPRSCRENGVAHPLLLLEEAAAEVEALRGAWAVAGDDALQFLPVGLAVLPHAVVVSAQLRIGNRQPELEDLRHVALEELLPRLFVALRLDPPQEHRVVLGRNRVPVELHQRAPPSVERLLHELVLLGRARDQREDDVPSVEDVERLLPADLL